MMSRIVHQNCFASAKAILKAGPCNVAIKFAGGFLSAFSYILFHHTLLKEGSWKLTPFPPQVPQHAKKVKDLGLELPLSVLSTAEHGTALLGC